MFGNKYGQDLAGIQVRREQLVVVGRREQIVPGKVQLEDAQRWEAQPWQEVIEIAIMRHMDLQVSQCGAMRQKIGHKRGRRPRELVAEAERVQPRECASPTEGEQPMGERVNRVFVFVVVTVTEKMKLRAGRAAG